MSNFDSSLSWNLPVHCGDRWRVYQRLQSLDIPCECSSYKPLQVYIASPMAIFQLWSVLRQVYSSRPELMDWLESCWKLPVGSNIDR